MTSTGIQANSWQSHLFASYRAIGLITNHVSFCVQVKGSDSFVTTVVGRSFHTYNCERLNLLFVSEPQQDEIAAITTDAKYIILAVKNSAVFLRRGKETFRLKTSSKNIKLFLQFANLLICVDDGNEVKVWDYESREEYLTLNFDKDHFEVTAMVHPATYLNKVLFGSSQGTMQLWNIKTNKLVYTFKGWEGGILCLEQAPALDVIGVGLSTGNIYLHNIRYDEQVMAFHQEYGPVTSMAFRTDGIPFMATGSTTGHITIWNLDSNKVGSVMRLSHSGAVHSLRFLTKQPLLLSAGDDNALRLWIFDNADGTARLLRSRSGHSAPVTSLRFYGAEGHVLLSSSVDRSLRYSSIINDHQSCELSQGSLAKKAKARGVSMETVRLPPITSFDFESTRERDWDNIVTCHSVTTSARSWSVRNKALGKHTFNRRIKKSVKQIPVAVKISSSGHFVVLGFSSGHVDVFNLQSGVHRGSFMDSSLTSWPKEGDVEATEERGERKSGKAHNGMLRGLAIDSADLVLASGSVDKTIKLWSFPTRKLSSTIAVDFPVRILILHKDSALLAVALDDFSVQIYDLDTQQLVRIFKGHRNIITSVAFSSDGRWLISAAMDSTVRVWNIPSARLIDVFSFESPVISLDLSPTSEFLATSHLDDPSIYLWSNKTLYGTALATPLQPDHPPIEVNLPCSQVEVAAEPDGSKQADPGPEVCDSDATESDMYESPEQLEETLVTLSLLPESRWHSLVHLDVIKARNKPKEPPKKPAKAPFFLTTIAGLEPTFVAKDDNKESGSKVVSIQRFEAESPFLSLLKDFVLAPDPNPIVQALKVMSPSSIDVEMRLLQSELTGNTYVRIFLEFLIRQLKTGRDFELLQGLIGIFLKHHGALISSYPELVTWARELLTALDSSWLRCEGMIGQSLCLLSYFKSVTM